MLRLWFSGCARLITSILVLSVIASDLVNHEIVGVGQLETGKVQAYGFQHFSSIYWALCGIEFP